MRKTQVAVMSLFFLLFVQSAFAAFSLDDERKVGKEFYDKLEKSGILYHDDRVNAYVTKVGKRIIDSIQPQPFEFRFSVIKSSAINAFATPGGYVYVNMGLISLVENEGQLASVLSHEIAHVTSRHIANIIEKSQKINIATLAAVIAGAFLGGGGDLTAAVTSFSMATAASLSLKYSREHEEEADRLGMLYLTGTGYKGRSMPEFLKKMSQYEYYSNNIPSYFLTHPGTDERIRYLDAVLQTRYLDSGKETIIGQLKRVQILIQIEQKSPDTNMLYYQSALEKNPQDADYFYGLAMAQDKLGLTKQSIDTYGMALALMPNDKDILCDLGIAYFKSGDQSDAVLFLKKAVEADIGNASALYYLGRSYEGSGNYASAIEIFKQVIVKDTANSEVFFNLAAAYGKINNSGESHFYFGRYFSKKNKSSSAMFHFQEALKYFPPDSGRAVEIKNYMKQTKMLETERPLNSKKDDRY